ncbi:MAG: hypothetical protein Tsb0015_13800 [Simkaniaceae bacterium]
MQILEQSPGNVMFYQPFTTKMFGLFHELQYELASEWKRGIDQQFLSFNDKNGLIAELSDQKELDAWNISLAKLTKAFSFHLFQDENIFSLVIEEMAKYLDVKINKDKLLLVELEVLFKKFLESQEKKQDDIIYQKIDSQLPEKVSAKVAVLYLFLFLRIPSQVFLNGAFTNLLHSFRSVYGKSSEDLIGELNNRHALESCKTQNIHVQFHPAFIEIKYLKRGFIFSQECYLTQETKVRMPYPGSPELKDPIFIQFYCEFPEHYKINPEFMKCLKQLSFLLKAKNFPGLKRIDIKKSQKI